MTQQPPGSTLDDLLQSLMTKRRVSAGRCRRIHLPLALLLLLLSLAPSASSSTWDGVAISQANYEGLLAFKHALLDPTGALRGWNDSGLDVCSGAWEGIKCAKGQVIAIQLPWHSLGGTISDKVGQLTALRKLNLHDNALHGEVPATLGLLTSLRGVYLFNNRFSGTIPPSIGNCLMLQTLDLSNNLLTGTIPASISNSTNLYRLNVSYNKLVGSIPADLTLLPSLGFLSLHHNNISGSIPNTWGDTNTTHHLRILSLDYNRLSGSIPTSLGRLPMLQEVTLSNNQIDGSIPEELGKLPMLKKLDLSHNSIAANFHDSLCNISTLVHLNLEGNQFGGTIPDAIDGLKNLTFLSLKWNRFTGSIPSTLGRIVNLLELDLSDNDLVGVIPVSFVQLIHLSAFNVSNNNLSGPVPPLLAENFNSTSFTGNIQLCGYSASVPCPSSPPPPSSNVTQIASPSTYSNSGNRKSSTGSVILLVVVGLVALLLVLCCVLLVCCLIRKRAVLAKKSVAASGAVRRAQKSGDAEGESGGEAGGKLVHFDGPMAFTADDLLCATAEIMGKTAYGTIYKATLEDGGQVAVKRLREKVSKAPKEFEGEVAVLGKIRHPNLLPLRAYYLGPKGEKLLVFDYMPNGSLASFLHARSPDTQIDWPSRVKLATGITRGLHHLHASENIIHGNLASSAILLDDAANPYITDYGLSRLMTAAAAASTTPTAGSLAYRAPELAKQKKATSKSDVYSLGIVMLEILTGRSPGEAMNGVDLPQWVASVAEEDWAKEVFDPELVREGTAGTVEEMLDVLKLAMRCVDPSPAARPEVENVLRQLEETAGGAGGSAVEVGSTGTSSS